MPKVSEIKFELAGKNYKINVNCTSNGQFNANLPDEVAEALRIEKKIVSDTLSALEKLFNEKLAAYKTAETKEVLYILVAYQARGKYMEKADGSFLFGQGDKKHYIESSFGEIENALGLDFTVAIKQTIDGKDKWFKAKLGRDCSHITKESNFPDVYHKQQTIPSHRLGRFKIIPFNEKAVETLLAAEEKLRMMSEMLFSFISQDEEQISLALTNQKLLA